MIRILHVEERTDLGHRFGPDEFRIHWEFVLQLRMLMPSLNEYWPHVSADAAAALADLLDAKRNNLSWRVHRHVWGDEEGVVVAEFVRFLRGGGFVVAA